METNELTFSKYSFLKELELEEENLGCYNGKNWTGSGKFMTSVNPSNNKVPFL